MRYLVLMLIIWGAASAVSASDLEGEAQSVDSSAVRSIVEEVVRGERSHICELPKPESFDFDRNPDTWVSSGGGRMAAYGGRSEYLRRMAGRRAGERAAGERRACERCR